MADLRLPLSEHIFDTTKPSEQWRASLLQATSLRFTRADEVEAGVRLLSLSASRAA
jgi:hypothetical protein